MKKLPFHINSRGKLVDAYPKVGVLGWTVKEVIGMAIVNPSGVANGKKSVIIGTK